MTKIFDQFQYFKEFYVSLNFREFREISEVIEAF